MLWMVQVPSLVAVKSGRNPRLALLPRNEGGHLMMMARPLGSEQSWKILNQLKLALKSCDATLYITHFNGLCGQSRCKVRHPGPSRWSCEAPELFDALPNTF